jgi:hypothetical protein
MRRSFAGKHSAHVLAAAAALVGWLACGTSLAGGPVQQGCVQPGCGLQGCGPAGCGPRGCGHKPCCRQGACCHHGRCCHHGLCGHPVGGPCSYGYGGGLCSEKHDVYEKRYFLRSQGKSWHSAWYDPWEGRPIALVVPPTAEFQTQYGWGVPSSRVAPIYHQFRRPYPGPGAVGGSSSSGFLPTPNIPSDTVQFGVNAVRGPWGAY